MDAGGGSGESEFDIPFSGCMGESAVFVDVEDDLWVCTTRARSCEEFVDNIIPERIFESRMMVTVRSSHHRCGAAVVWRND